MSILVSDVCLYVCVECVCSEQGTVAQVCDEDTGRCLCQDSFTGAQCDRCATGFYRFPQCLCMYVPLSVSLSLSVAQLLTCCQCKRHHHDFVLLVARALAELCSICSQWGFSSNGAHCSGGDRLRAGVISRAHGWERRFHCWKADGTHGNDVRVFKNALWTSLRTIFRSKCTRLQEFSYTVKIFPRGDILGLPQKRPQCLDPGTNFRLPCQRPIVSVSQNDHWLRGLCQRWL